MGTHRHGCCVLQRCIDHASGNQKSDLIAQITQNAYDLVQDPFGNYVLQYIVDLNEAIYTEPLCYTFQKNVPSLSKHKFSSNVVEKCLRHAEPKIAGMMVEEMLRENELERMLRDSFANYVVQTALDYADADTRTRLTEAIRPILPSIRGTPYGRRIQTKILGLGENNGLLPSPLDAPAGPGQMGKQAANGHNSYNAPPASRGNMYNQPDQSVYPQGEVPSRMPYNGQGPTSPNKYNNGAQAFPPYHQAKPQPFVQHQHNMSNGQRMPQTNGFNYF